MMKKNLVIIFASLVTLCEAQLSGKATIITDGDSFTLFMINKSQVRIELYGIDCPEQGQGYAKKAKDFLKNLIANKNVKVKRMEIDSNGRTVGIVTVGDKVVNEELLKAGLAWHLVKDNNEAWTALETEAKNKKIGLWSSGNPIPPWEWRKDH